MVIILPEVAFVKPWIRNIYLEAILGFFGYAILHFDISQQEAHFLENAKDIGS